MVCTLFGQLHVDFFLIAGYFHSLIACHLIQFTTAATKYCIVF